MEYIIQPLIGVNEFVFGDYRKDILAKTSLKIKTTREEKDGNNSFIIDDYGDFLVYYNGSVLKPSCKPILLSA